VLEAVLAGRDEKCRSRYIPADQLDQLVWQDVCHVLQHPRVIEQALQRALGGAWLPQAMQARKEQLRKTKASLKAQLERLTEAYLAGILPLAEYKRRRHEVEQRMEAVDHQARQFEVQVQQHLELTDLAHSSTEFCQRISRGLEQATFEQKRQLVELLIDRVVVTNEEVEIRYVIPISSESESVRFCHLLTDYSGAEGVFEIKGGTLTAQRKTACCNCSTCWNRRMGSSDRAASVSSCCFWAGKTPDGSKRCSGVLAES
jgi:site-specific DNA recombinase